MDDRFRTLRDATIASVTTSAATTPAELRRALFDGEPPEALRAFREKVRREPWRVTDEDWVPLASYTEDQRFELVVATVLGAATERFDAALRALEGA
jgi:hypothetical protein